MHELSRGANSDQSAAPLHVSSRFHRRLTMHLSQFKRMMFCISVVAFVATSLLCYYVTIVGTKAVRVSVESVHWNSTRHNTGIRYLKLLTTDIDYPHQNEIESLENGSSKSLEALATNITEIEISADHTVAEQLLSTNHHDNSSYTLITPVPKQRTVDTHPHNKYSQPTSASHVKIVFLDASRQQHQMTSPPPTSSESANRALSVQSTEQMVTHTQVHVRTVQQKNKGYVLAQKIYEQQTMASGNLFQLQCLARHLQLLVVKPAMHNSILHTPLHQQTYTSMMKLEDTFDIRSWENEANRRGYSPLVDWEDFIENAPRNVIYAQMRYTSTTHAKELRSQGVVFPHPAGEAYKQGCKFKIAGKDMDFLSANGFKVVRNACFNFATGDELTPQQFREHLLGGLSEDDVTVIINEWRGLGESQRALVKDDVCTERPFFREMTEPSDRLIKDTERYAAKYLRGVNNYVAIITRFEMAAITHKSKNPDDPYEIIPYCVKLVTKEWKVIKTRTGINTTFLAIDIGRFGSGSFVQKNYCNHLDDMVSLVNDIYGNMTLREWERTFEDIANTVDTGYIGMLQLLIVTRARCILFMGGGSYQRHALNLYKKLHPDANDQCIYVIDRCTNPSRSIQT